MPAKQGMQICRCARCPAAPRPDKSGRSCWIYTRFHHDSLENAKDAL